MDEMIPRAQAEAMVAKAVSEAVKPLQEALAQATEALVQAKAIIRAMQAKIYGVKAETIQVVLTAEGQQHLELQWNEATGTDAVTDPPKDVTPAPVAEVPAAKTVRTPRDRRGLAQRYPHLPIVEVTAAVPAELQAEIDAGTLTARRSNRFQDELVVPAQRPLVRRVYEVELLRKPNDQLVVQVSQDRLVPGGDLADESIHHFVTTKFLDAMPFHRQIAQLARHGINLSRQTVNDVTKVWSETFQPLAETIREQVLEAAVVHADASWARIQAAGSCDRINLWTWVGGGQVAYTCTKDLCNARAAELIPPTFTGRLVSDGWPGWATLDFLGDRHAYCNAHARRPFAAYAKHTKDDPDATLMLRLYAEIYRIELEIADQPPEQRKTIRQQQTRRVMDKIQVQATRIASTLSKRHPLAEGARYILKHWTGLTRFLDDPLLPPDNNTAENALRINALVRKNSLFFGTPEAAERGAIAFTILHSCRLTGHIPADYLARVTPTLLLHRRGRKQDLSDLTPLRLPKSSQTAAAV